MVIISEQSQLAATKQHGIRPATRGASFSERLEAGNSARQVTQERALGFAETGLLGVHYAHNLAENAAGHAAGPRIDAAVDQSNSSEGLDIMPKDAELTPLEYGKINFLRLLSDKSTISVPSSRLNIQGNSLGLLFTSTAAEFSWANLVAEAKTPSSVNQKCFQKSLLSKGIEAGLTLRIVENPRGISIVCDDDIVSDSSVEEFIELAREVAKDFGVTVRRFVVSKNT